MRMVNTIIVGAGWLFLNATVSLSAVPEMGAPVEVAPRVESTPQQRWPRAVWSEGLKCWLVV